MIAKTTRDLGRAGPRPKVLVHRNILV